MIFLKLSLAAMAALFLTIGCLFPSTRSVAAFRPPIMQRTPRLIRHAMDVSSSLKPTIHVPRGGGLFSSTDDTFQNDIQSNMSEESLTSNSESSTESSARLPVDYAAIGKWAVGYSGQLLLIYGFLSILDKVVAKFNLLPLPYYITIPFFYAFNLKTSLFNLLPNQKTKSQKMTQDDWEYNKRNKPSWTPPGFVFALMWPLFVFGMRATTAAMVYSKTGTLACAPILMLMAHLSVGSLWNTVNNIERRLGPSVLLLYALALTKAATAFAFYQVHPLAGKLLALTMTWLTAAAALETQTWRLNPDPDTGKKEPLYPAKMAKWKTEFRSFRFGA